MMEPVAWASRSPRINNIVSHKRNETFTVPLVRLSDAEARIKELEELAKALEAEANQMREVSIKNRHRATAAEALLKEAGKVLEPFLKLDEGFIGQRTDNDVVQVTWTPNGPHKITFGHLRAARAICDKIGGGE